MWSIYIYFEFFVATFKVVGHGQHQNVTTIKNLTDIYVFTHVKRNINCGNATES